MTANITAYLAMHAQVSPGKPALIVLEDGEDRERRICFLELYEKVLQLAAILYSKGWSRKRAVLLYHEAADFLVAFLACQHAGVVAVPLFFLNGAKQKTRLDAMLKDCGAGIVLTTAKNSAVVSTFFSSNGKNSVELFITDNIAGNAGAIHPADTGEALAFIQYSSGSTSRLKGIMITAGNLLSNQQCLADTFHCNTESVIFSWLPFYHDMGLIGNLLHAIFIGCTCIAMSPFHFMQRPARWLRAISKYKVTHSGGPNFAYDLCIARIPNGEEDGLDLSAWKVAFNGSEPVRAATVQKFSERFKKAGFRESSFYACYGLAEATLLVTGAKAENALPQIVSVNKYVAGATEVQIAGHAADHSIKVMSCGQPAHGMDVKILLASGSITGHDLQHGEVCIAGTSVTPGYCNHGDDLFIQDGEKKYLRTGDTGFFYKGELFINGRLKEMLVIRGRNIYPYDIEQAVGSSVNAVHNNGVVVFGCADPDDKLVVVAELLKSALNPEAYVEIINRVEKEVVAVAGISPFDIVLVKPLGIPRTTSGKLQRIKCKELYGDQALSMVASKTAKGNKTAYTRNVHLLDAVLARKDAASIEEYIIDIIKSKLPGISYLPVVTHMGLTDIGLDSIKAMEIVNTVSRELNIGIDISRVFQENTVGYLATLIENTLWLRSNQPNGKEIIL